jgi:prolipoprotein diacylglyceryltransferase
MLPVVLRFTHPFWGFVLPALLALLGAFLVWMAWQARRESSRSATGILVLAAMLVAATSVQRALHPSIPAPVVVHAFGAFLCAASLAAWGLAAHSVNERQLSRDHLPGAFVSCAVGALLGARLLFVLSTQGVEWREGLALHHGGLSLWGGILAGGLTLWVYCRWTAQAPWPWAAALAPSALLAVALGRLGSFASGAHFGRELSADASSLLRGLGTYPRWSDEVRALTAGPPVWLAQVEKQHILASRLLSNPTHPVQLYEALLLAALVALIRWRRGRLGPAREQCLLLGFAYAATAFALEYLRGDTDRGLWGPNLSVSLALWGGGLLVLVALLVILSGLGYAGTTRWRWIAGFAAGYGLMLWSIGGQLAQERVRVMQLSSAQWLALLTASGLASLALLRPRPRLATTPASPQ